MLGAKDGFNWASLIDAEIPDYEDVQKETNRLTINTMKRLFPEANADKKEIDQKE